MSEQKKQLPSQQKTMAPAESLRGDLIRMTPEFKKALPKGVDPDKFVRILISTVQSNPGFLSADRTSLFNACVACAKDGLWPDGRDAAMIPYGNKVEYQRMVGGIYKMAHRSGAVKLLVADLVYHGDDLRFGTSSERGRFLEHQPKVENMGGLMENVACVFALARLENGEVDYEVMSTDQVEHTRKTSSKAQNSPAWKNFWGEMAKKTVAKRLAKRLDLDEKTREALNQDDEENFEVSLKPKTRSEELQEKLRGGPAPLAPITMSDSDIEASSTIEVESRPVEVSSDWEKAADSTPDPRVVK